MGEVELLSEASLEATYRIPADSAPLFRQFFEDFDEQLAMLHISSYGISVTTLEEVFLKVAKQGFLDTIMQNVTMKEEDFT